MKTGKTIGQSSSPVTPVVQKKRCGDISTGKHLPNVSGTDTTHVKLTLDGQIQDPGVLQMMEEIGEETLATFSTEDFLVVNQFIGNRQSESSCANSKIVEKCIQLARQTRQSGILVMCNSLLYNELWAIVCCN